MNPDMNRNLYENGLLRDIHDCFCRLDLHSCQVSDIEMGYLFKELVQQFPEMSNETADEQFASQELYQFPVDLLLINDDEALTCKDTAAVAGEINIEDMT